jgi:LysR family transcriptional regulator, hca operon transcriptional activator
MRLLGHITTAKENPAEAGFPSLLPISAENFLTWSVVSRPLKGELPTVDLVVG